MKYPFHITLFVQSKCKEIEKYLSVARIGIKIVLVICIGNETIHKYNIDMPYVLKHMRYYMYKVILTRFK